MGKGVAKVLSSSGQNEHELIILCRSKALGQEVIEEFRKECSNTKASMVLCDLTKFSDVKRAIHELHEKHDSLDGIFINAGIGYAPQRVETEDGLDAHFQVNYLSQYMLVLNLLDLIEKSESGGRIIFNAASFGEMHWDNLQMADKWNYEQAIGQAMVAKRMFLYRLHRLYQNKPNVSISFVGFHISKTVWTNQLNIIPAPMRIAASLMKLFGTFISMETCGKIMAPLFTEDARHSLEKSGKLMTWKKGAFIEIDEKDFALDEALQDKLWDISLSLCKDDKTLEISNEIQDHLT